MTDIDRYRADARTWLAGIVPQFGHDARRGLSVEDDLALAKRYMRAKYDAGYAGINWPVDMGGQGLTHIEKLAFDTEEMGLGLPNRYFTISLGMPIPVLMKYGTDRDFARERTIAALKGEEMWCQMFSEPAGGSDLAGLRMKAEPHGNGWKLNGQKVWTSWAQYCDYGVVVARTDPTVAKHQGLTYFWVDMRSPGIEVRPIKLAGGDSHVNEVWFDDVTFGDDQRMSPVGGGFGVAMHTLLIERYVAADSNGFGPHLELFVDLAKTVEVNGRPASQDGRVRRELARNYAMRSGLDAITRRGMLALQSGQEPGSEGSLGKLVSARSRQKLSELAIDLQGAPGMAFDEHDFVTDDWATSWINAPTGRIAGGADEMLLNTIAERVLGLPQDHRPDKGVPFNQIPA